jgi:hypothetical protein
METAASFEARFAPSPYPTVYYIGIQTTPGNFSLSMK